MNHHDKSFFSLDRQYERIKRRERQFEIMVYVCVIMAGIIFGLAIVVYQTIGG